MNENNEQTTRDRTNRDFISFSGHPWKVPLFIGVFACTVAFVFEIRAMYIAQAVLLFSVLVPTVSHFLQRALHICNSATILGVMSVGLFGSFLLSVYLVDTPWDALWSMCMFAPFLLAFLYSTTGFLSEARNSRLRRRENTRAAIIAFVLVATGLSIGLPLTIHLRVSRHYAQAELKQPALAAVASDVEVFCKNKGRTPDDGEFLSILSTLAVRNAAVRSLCDEFDWGINCRRVSGSHFQLIYSSMDVRLIYDSEMPQGWVARTRLWTARNQGRMRLAWHRLFSKFPRRKVTNRAR